ncbi:MAG: 2-polyprenyl-3-methyl-5-hydroxy-6-metoxy-1,4-benzoquinol methylase [Patiriisocius sp.]|jgi:2-polyprenyl-3-methyl-5-hydroxy-6-metoxy-1,4-benzoquinol methylase
MIFFSKHTRSRQQEIMDNFSLQGAEMETLLTDLKRVNKLLGGNRITTHGIETLLQQHPTDKNIRIVDVGCGDGELLRQCALWARRNRYQFKLIGIDANPHILKEAALRSLKFPEIEYRVLDIFSKEIKTLDVDICLCTLFLHHFKNKDIVEILNKLISQSRIGVVVNDLQRSRLAFQLFKPFSAIFIRTKIAKHDGLVSVARGFQKKELEELAAKIPVIKHQINWKWAFRYQWLLFK